MQNPEYPGFFVRSQVIEPLVSAVAVAARVLTLLQQPLFALAEGSAKLALPINKKKKKTLGLNIGHLL